MQIADLRIKSDKFQMALSSQKCIWYNLICRWGFSNQISSFNFTTFCSQIKSSIFNHLWPLLGTTKNFRPNARDPPRTRLNNTTSQFSLPSTGDPCIIHKKYGPVESECKLNNVNPHIIRNQYQNQIEVTLNEDKYCKSCHYHTNTEF